MVSIRKLRALPYDARVNLIGRLPSIHERKEEAFLMMQENKDRMNPGLENIILMSQPNSDEIFKLSRFECNPENIVKHLIASREILFIPILPIRQTLTNFKRRGDIEGIVSEILKAYIKYNKFGHIENLIHYHYCTDKQKEYYVNFLLTDIANEGHILFLKRIRHHVDSGLKKRIDDSLIISDIIL